jgi:DNA (cytosine-5)-methyltransferase 1
MWKHMARIIGEVRPRYAFVENSPLLVGRGAAMVIGDLAKMGYDCQWCIVSASDCGAPHQRDRFWLLATVSDTTSYGGYRTSDEAGREAKRQDGKPDKQLAEYGEVQLMADSAQLQRNGINDHTGIIMESEQVPQSGNDSGTQHMADTNSTQCKGRGISGGISAQNTNAGSYGANAEVSDTTSQRQSGPGQSWFGSDPAEKREGETDRAFAERIGHIWGIESPMGRVADGVAARVDRLKAIGNGQVSIVAATAWRILTGTTKERP